MVDRISMSNSVDSPSDETLNRGPLLLLLRRQYEFPFGIIIVQFSIHDEINIFIITFCKYRFSAVNSTWLSLVASCSFSRNKAEKQNQSKIEI